MPQELSDSLPGPLVRLASCFEVCPFGISNEIVLLALSKSGRALEDPSPQLCLRRFSRSTRLIRGKSQRSAERSHWYLVPRNKRLDPRPLPQTVANSRLHRIKAGLTLPRERLRLQASSPKLECPCFRLSETVGRGRSDYYLTLLRNKKKKCQVWRRGSDR